MFLSRERGGTDFWKYQIDYSELGGKGIQPIPRQLRAKLFPARNQSRSIDHQQLVPLEKKSNFQQKIREIQYFVNTSALRDTSWYCAGMTWWRIYRHHMTASEVRYTLWYLAITASWQNKISYGSISIPLYFMISCCHDFILWDISLLLYFMISRCHDLVAKWNIMWQHQYFVIIYDILLSRLLIMWQHQYCIILYDILLSRLGGKIRYHVTASVLHATNCQTRPCNPMLKRISKC